MKIILRITLLLLVLVNCFCCQSNNSVSQEERVNSFSLTMKNTSNQNWIAEPVELSTSFLTKGKAVVDWEKIAFSDGENLPFQLIDEDGNGTPENVLLAVSLKAKEEKTIKVAFTDTAPDNNFIKRTQAEISHKVNGEWKERKYKEGTFKNVKALSVPAEHTDHSEYIRYEGPGWESDKVGYRFYLDWRNAVDVFGKKTSEMVLQKVGLDGFASYHEPADWGMDVLKVGSSLGIGSIGFWANGKATRIEKTDSLHCEILQDGILQSKIRTTYSGWEINDQKLNLISDLSIRAGSRLTRQDIVMEEAILNICTGIVKHKNAELLTKMPNEKSPWGYIATFGKQSLADDNLGMVVFFNSSSFVAIQEDEHSHILVLKPAGNKLSYYFAAAWEQEEQGIKNKEEFKEYLERQRIKLNTGITVDLVAAGS